jgi:ferredoxin
MISNAESDCDPNSDLDIQGSSRITVFPPELRTCKLNPGQESRARRRFPLASNQSEGMRYMRRKIIRIDEDKCNGCGLCIPGCPEGALRIIDGKARLVGEVYCDGLGACLGHCPEGAISVEEREADDYDEVRVMENVVRQGQETVEAHLDHLRAHNEAGHLNAALEFLRRREQQTPRPFDLPIHPPMPGQGGCPGSQSRTVHPVERSAEEAGGRVSRLTHWPIQLHLINPLAPHYQGADLLLAADCVPFALADFHKDYLNGKKLAIACPKLDDGQEVYLEKLTALVDRAGIRSVTVLIMQVPCCSGLLHLARQAVNQASRQVPIEAIVVSLEGKILQRLAVSAA